MKQILLVAINAKYIHSNLAVYSLKANAGKYAKQVDMVEYTINHRKEEILEGIYRRQPDVVGFSCYIWNIDYVLSVAETLKKVLPHVRIVLGGPEVSYNAKELLQQYDFMDEIILGEGEATFREYLQCLEEEGALTQVAGLCIRDNQENIVTTPTRAPMDLDDLVFCYGDLTEMEHRIIYYETQRGCPFSCSYCLSSIDKSVRFRSLEKVFAELTFFLEHNVKQVKFVDRTFNCNHEHAYAIWNFIREHDNGITNFHFEIGGDLLKEQDFRLFEEFRPELVQFEIGVQSTNEKTIEAIRRKMDIKELRQDIERVRKLGNIHQHLDLIAGLPYEDYDSFHQSFCDVYAMRPDQLQLGFLKVLKGSYMDETKAQYDVAYGSYPPYEVLSTKWLSYGDVLRLKQVEEMVEVYYNSFQFQATMSLLEAYEKDSFVIYENLGAYYEEKGYFGRKHNRVARYEILWEYICQRYPQQREAFRQTLTYDLYLRDYVKNPPAYVVPRDGEYLGQVRKFLDEQCENPTILKGYDGYVTKQLFHMIYVDCFTLDFEMLLKNREECYLPQYSLVFDYENRNPLNHSANVQVVALGNE